ncbi:hypothetical protein DY000_02022244 [Brassica cretica]|nr:hypothetical protein DY000_02022244 [Brassica cretica]
MVVLKKERPLEACPSHSYSLSKEKGESFHLVPDYGDSKHEEKRCLRYGGFKRKSMKEGDVGSDTKSSDLPMFTRCVLSSPFIQVKRGRLCPFVCAMESCYKKATLGVMRPVLLLTIASNWRRSQPGLVSGVSIQESAQTKTEHSWLCEEEGYSIKEASSVR